MSGSNRKTSGRGHMTQTAFNRWMPVAFTTPMLVVFVILTVIPLVNTVYYSFTDYNGYSDDVNFVAFDNYADVFSDPSILGGLAFTLLYTVVVTFVVTVLAIWLAVVLNKKFIGRNFARALFFFIGVPAQAILGLVWQYIFSPLKSGVANQLLAVFGLEPLSWLADNNLARFCVMFVAIWAQVGWHATLYLAYLQAIPSDLYEQATVDGANARQRFIHITLPQLTPAMTVSIFLLVNGGLKVYDLPYTLTKGGPGYATNTITQTIILRGIGQSEYGVGSALSVLFTLATLVILVTQLRISSLIDRRFS